MGAKTKRAFERFLKYSGQSIRPSAILESSALTALSNTKDKLCTATWLAVHKPNALAGGWAGRSNCVINGRTEMWRATFQLKHTGGGNFSGKARARHKNRAGQTLQVVHNVQMAARAGRLNGTLRAPGFAQNFSGTLSKSSNAITVVAGNCRATLWKSD